jgi:integrase
MDCDLPFIHAYDDRHGTRRHYFRRNGKKTALPGKPGSPEFVAAYNAALEPKPALPAAAATKAAPGTIDALRETYYASPEFKDNLAETTRRETRYVLDELCARPKKSGDGNIGGAKVTSIAKRHVKDWRAHFVGRPGAANKFLRTVKAFLTFAVDSEILETNPAFGIKPLKAGRIRAWDDEELLAFEERWPLGTIERTGYALALYTAQRRSDVAAMTWKKIAGKVIRVKQKKTSTPLKIPLHANLQAALAAAKRCGDTILAHDDGEPFSPVYFGHRMAAAIEAAGLPDECVLHGLRKAAARIVAETGGRVRSMTGHLSAAMEREYEADADMGKMAVVAMQKWKKNRA